jgi:hypothetical protein
MNKHEIIKAYEGFIESGVRPDIYSVASLRQYVRSYALGYPTRIDGNEGEYRKACQQFQKRLSRVVYGDTICKRHKKLFPMFVTLEGGYNGKRYHLNICVQTPENMDFEQFKLIFLKEWAKSDWAMPNVIGPKAKQHNVRFEKRTGNCVRYSLKEGYERILIP